MSEKTTLSPTRLFRFGAIAHPSYQAQAFELMDVEDRLNAAAQRAAATATDFPQSIYFIPIMVPDTLAPGYADEEEISYHADEQRVFIRQLVPAGTEPLTVLRTALADLGERYPAVVPVRALVAEVLGEDGW